MKVYVCLLDGIEIYRSNISMLLILNRNSIRLHMKFSQLATESVSITFAMPVGSTNWLITLDNIIYEYIQHTYARRRRMLYIVFRTSRSQKNLCISDQIRFQCSAFYFSALISLFLHHVKRVFRFPFPFLFSFFFFVESSTDCGNSFRFSMLWPAVI